jgi:hypothetical protein
VYILYRAKNGRFISKRSAKRRKPENVLSELREKNKSLRIVRGYHESLRRPAKPKRKIIPSVVSIPPRRRIFAEEEEFEERETPFRPREVIEAEEEVEEEEEALYTGEDEEVEEWTDLESEFRFLDGLDYLDDIFDYPEDEDWYEET